LAGGLLPVSLTVLVSSTVFVPPGVEVVDFVVVLALSPQPNENEDITANISAQAIKRFIERIPPTVGQINRSEPLANDWHGARQTPRASGRAVIMPQSG
jgi:hypothetical protein